MGTRDYFESISYAANTILEGMAVTFSHLFREPITVQDPDRIDRPITETLPDRYRGFLEVQLDICTGCRRCQRACPIDCIVVDLAKNPETKKKEMVRFDIDIGKCMFCGLCVEACKVESTGAIRHTVNFEGTTEDFDTLTFRFIEEGCSVPLYRAPKDKSEIPLGSYGPIACEARERALRDNPTDLQKQRVIWEEEQERKRQAAAEAAEAASKEEAAKKAAAAAEAAATDAAEAEAGPAAEAEAAKEDEGAADDSPADDSPIGEAKKD